MILGITGSSGSGKSAVSAIFAEKGFTVIDSDRISREIAVAGSPCLKEITENFGDGIICPDKSLDRRKLGSIVFKDAKKLSLLNSITHKYILAEIESRIKKAKGNILIDAPLLFETELDRKCDFTIGVISEREKQIERIQKRDGISYEIASARLENQHTNDFYKERCSFIIENSSSENELKKSTLSLIDKIITSERK